MQSRDGQFYAYPPPPPPPPMPPPPGDEGGGTSPGLGMDGVDTNTAAAAAAMAQPAEPPAAAAAEPRSSVRREPAPRGTVRPRCRGRGGGEEAGEDAVAR
eukprot:83312-Chlamydomonas_euryale.AAC.8